MRAKVVCKEVEKGTLSFYVVAEGKEFYLFQQPFKKSVKDYFGGGVLINEANYASARGEAVKKTLDKLPSYLKYIEKEYDVAVFEKTRKAKSKKRSKVYKRQTFHWQDYAFAM